MDIIVFVSMLATGLISTYLMIKYAVSKQVINFEQKLRDSRGVHLIMDQLRDNTNIERVIVLRCNNGKGIHTFGFQLYIDGVYQSYEPPFRSVIEKYKQLTIDGPTTEIVQQIYDNGYTAFYPDNLRDCILKRIYMSSGVQWAGIYSLGENKKEHMFYFMSIATSQPKSPFELNQGGDVELAVNDMRNVFKKLNRGMWSRIFLNK